MRKWIYTCMAVLQIVSRGVEHRYGDKIIEIRFRCGMKKGVTSDNDCLDFDGCFAFT